MSLAYRGYEILLQGMTEYAIFMVDSAGTIAVWSAGAERIKGYQAQEIIGRHFSCFHTAEDLSAGLPAIALAAARRDGRHEADGWRVRKDGSRFWANAMLAAVHDDDGAVIGFANVTRDLSARSAAQRELEQSRDLLFQAQKMEAIGQLAGGLAHDFNNVLTGITGNLFLLERRLAHGEPADLSRHVSAALQGASRAAALAARLLTVTRQQSAEPKAVDVARLIDELEELLKRTLGPEIDIETSQQDALWPVFCNPGQFENAILNLCINSRDAMPRGGRLTVVTRNVRLSNTEAEQHAVRPGDYVSIRVTDNGTGMPPDVAERAFAPLFTTKPPGKGTGLGLPMIHHFARSSGGCVRLQTALGEGTTVRIDLPRYV